MEELRPQIPKILPFEAVFATRLANVVPDYAL